MLCNFWLFFFSEWFPTLHYFSQPSFEWNTWSSPPDILQSDVLQILQVLCRINHIRNSANLDVSPYPLVTRSCMLSNLPLDCMFSIGQVCLLLCTSEERHYVDKAFYPEPEIGNWPTWGLNPQTLHPQNPEMNSLLTEPQIPTHTWVPCRNKQILRNYLALC